MRNLDLRKQLKSFGKGLLRGAAAGATAGASEGGRIGEKIYETYQSYNKKPKVGFILLTAEFGKIDGGRVNYISNGEREDMIAMMREYLARVEGRYSDGPTTRQ